MPAVHTVDMTRFGIDSTVAIRLAAEHLTVSDAHRLVALAPFEALLGATS
ncbi:hypothetical protein BH11ACT2_BH11ACT2_18050 [soil metagenome]